MKENPAGHRWGVEKRLEFVDFRLYWDGRINRGDLVERFGISVPQASMDLRNYQEAAPSNVFYDKTEKAYLVADTFVPAFFTPSADHFLAQLRLFAAGILEEGQLWVGSTPKFATLPILRRRSDPGILRRILKAVRSQSSLRVLYQSFSHPSPTWRWISPHAIAFDGFRWHMRCWCFSRHAFRDFVIARVHEISEQKESEIDPALDEGWTREITFRIAPHPDMNEGARQAIELDFGMENGVVEVRTRICLAHYLERQLGLDLDPKTLGSDRQQIVLVNRAEIDEAIREAEELSRSGTSENR